VAPINSTCTGKDNVTPQIGILKMEAILAIRHAVCESTIFGNQSRDRSWWPNYLPIGEPELHNSVHGVYAPGTEKEIAR
jgi:hypothetical protein